MNVHDALTQWGQYRLKLCYLGLVAESTFRNQDGIALHLAAALGGHELDALRKSHVELWMGERLRTCQPVTVRGEMNVLRQFLNWAVDEQLLVQRPKLPMLSVPTTEAELPSDEAYAWFLRTMPPRHADALQFMLLTGLSPHELERLEARDVDHAAGDVLVGLRDDFAVKQAARRRRVPLNPTAKLIWHRATLGFPDHAHPFPGVDAMQKAMRRHVLDRADGPPEADGLTPKMMRKWFASKVAAEHSEAVLQRLLGHAPGSPITRRHYVRSNGDQLTRATAGLAL